MALESLIPIIIIIFILFIAWTLFKKIFKVLFYIGVIIILLIAVNSYFLYQDVADLRQNLANSEKKVILVDDEEVITGFLLNGEVDFLDSKQIEEFSSYLEDKNYNQILGESYKLMVFNIDIISNLNIAEVEIGDNKISKDDIISILKSNNPFALLTDESVVEDDLTINLEDTKDNTKVKAALFGIVLTDNILNSKNPLFFLSEFKKGNIAIYPETILFKTVKFIPISFLKSSAEKIFGKVKEKTKTFVVEASEFCYPETARQIKTARHFLFHPKLL